MKENEIALPEGWEMKKLGEFLDFAGGGTPDKSQKGYWNGDIPWASVKDIKERYLTLTQDTITKEGLNSSASQMAKIGDVILITRISPGKTTIAKIDTAINQDLKIIRPKIKIGSLFLHYLFETIGKEIVKASSGTTVLGIRLDTLKEIQIPLPPIAEQHRIVSKIEELFSELEKGKEQILLAQQQLNTYRQAVLKWAFEGRLTNADVADGVLPEGWEWKCMGEIIEKPKYGTSKKCDYDTPGIAVLRIPNIGDGRIDETDLKFADFDDAEIEGYRLREGDILTIRSNGSVDLVGKCALISKQNEKYLYAGYLIRLRPIPTLVNPKYLINALGSKLLREQIESKAKSTSGVNNINTEELKGLELAVAPLEEQHRIVQEIESRLSVCDAMEATLQTSLAQAEVLRQSILKRAFEGRLV